MWAVFVCVSVNLHFVHCLHEFVCTFPISKQTHVGSVQRVWSFLGFDRSFGGHSQSARKHKHQKLVEFS